jgi:hypothetical protein
MTLPPSEAAPALNLYPSRQGPHQPLSRDPEPVSPGTIDNRRGHVPQGNENEFSTDIVAAINQQTSGTEFYGRSSNFVLLNQLLSQARERLPAGSPEFPSNPSPITRSSPSHVSAARHQSVEGNPTPPVDAGPGDASQTPLSVINLLCDESATLPDPRPASPVTVAGRSQKLQSRNGRNHVNSQVPRLQVSAQDVACQFEASSSDQGAFVADHNSSDCFFGNPMLLEREYVGQYFQNLHCLHPFLSPDIFKSRCEKEVWASSALRRLRRNQMHFLSLYNAVLAVGALTAPTDAFRGLRAELEIRSEDDRRLGPKYIPSSIRLSKLYFQRARKLLGDLFEVCSLEGTQSLLLLVS